MNFSPWNSIKESVLSGNKFWTVHDQTGRRLLYEYNASEISPEASAEKLKSILDAESGEYLIVKLSAKAGIEKAQGGNTKTFTYYYQLNQLTKHQAPAANGGISLDTYIELLSRCASKDLEIFALKKQIEALEQEQPASPLERLLTEDNINKILSAFVKKQPAPKISGPDTEIETAVQTICGFPDGKKALINIAAAGPSVWSIIHGGLKENGFV